MALKFEVKSYLSYFKSMRSQEKLVCWSIFDFGWTSFLVVSFFLNFDLLFSPLLLSPVLAPLPPSITRHLGEQTTAILCSSQIPEIEGFRMTFVCLVGHTEHYHYQ